MGYVTDYALDVGPTSHPELGGDRLCGQLLSRFVRLTKIYRLPNETERNHLQALKYALAELPDHAGGKIFSPSLCGRQICRLRKLRDWFKCLYEVLLGQTEGPRLGSFFALYGLDKSIQLIDDALVGRLSASADVAG